MSNPLITIGITCFNSKDTIRKAVQSAQHQDWPHKEIIIVDDVSSDETRAVLEAVSTGYAEIIVIFREQNGGVAAARNDIIEHAKGEFIAFMDDDDESDPARLSAQYRRIEAYKTATPEAPYVICHTARIQNYPDGTRRYEPTMGMVSGEEPYSEAVAERILIGRPVPGIHGSLATCSQMARTKTYRDLGGFDVNFRRSEDTDFAIRAALAGAHFVGLPAPLVTQTMTKRSDKTIDDEKKYALMLLEKHKGFIEQKSSYHASHDWLVAKYDFLAGHKAHFILQVLAIMLKNPLFTARRILWALPNLGFNLKSRQFHNEK